MKIEFVDDIVNKNITGSEIAKKHGVSQSYVSTMRYNVDQMKYNPFFVEGVLVCSKCKKRTQKLSIHHIHETKEPIALVCPGCNLSLRQKDIIDNDGLELNEKDRGIYKTGGNSYGRTIYIPHEFVWMFDKFTLDELDILLKDGTSLFEYMAETPKSKALLEYNKRLASVIEKW